MELKADRNKTIDFSLEEGQPYLERCVSLSNLVNWSKSSGGLKKLFRS